MTDDDRISTLLRSALVPTPQDHARAEQIVDDVVTHEPRRSSHRTHRWVPAAAAAAALLLAAGVALPSVLRPDAGPDRTVASSADQRFDGTQFVDVPAWLNEAYLTVDWVNHDFIQSPLVAVRSAPECPACGGEDFLAPIIASAKAQPGTRFVVLVPGTDIADSGRFNQGIPSNMRVLGAGATTRLPGEPETGTDTPALVRISPMSSLTRYARGADAVDAALSTSAPQVLTVRCTDSGATLDATTVAAASDGVHVLFVNGGSKPVAPGLSDVPDGAGWDWVAPGKSLDVILPAAPGPHQVSCSGPSDQNRPTVTVTDPTSSWRGLVTDAEPTCTANALADYAGGPGEGRTARDAASTWPSSAGDPQIRPRSTTAGVTVRPIAAGYVDASSQWWVVANSGRPETLLRVTMTHRKPTKDNLATTWYTATPEHPCGL